MRTVYLLLTGACALALPGSAAARDYTTVLWDETHGVYSTYGYTGVFSNFTAQMRGEGYTVGNITGGVGATDLDSLGVLIVSVTSVDTSAYTTAEVTAIQSFVNDGGGLFVLCDNSAISWQTNLDPVTSAFGIGCHTGGLSNLTTFVSHPVTTGVTSLIGAASGSLSPGSSSTTVATDGTSPGVVVQEYGAGRIVVVGDVNYFDNTRLSSASNALFASNVLDWLSWSQGAELPDVDVDGDGYTTADDCDDGDAAINPAATEVCDGANVDEDCDGLADDSDASASTATMSTFYADDDGDTYGDAGSPTLACDLPTGHVVDATDCDDTLAGVNPGATEVCDADDVDEDCDGDADDADASVAPDSRSTFYADTDGDGYGDASAPTDACDQPTGHVTDSTDCDDLHGTAWPGATEVCDTLDNDCDGAIDEDDATDADTWYADADGDGFGDAATTDVACEQPSGFVATGTDCRDDLSSVYPGATERCDGLDDDCDGSPAADEGDDDGDGYVECLEDGAWLGDSIVGYGDCDDSDPTRYPTAAEIPYDAVDQDCDGVDLCDADLDGHSDVSCGGDDCDDEDETVYPDAEETWYDGIDQDCDEASDFDQDGDGYDSASYGGTDCDDADPTVYVGAEDVHYDGVINDCDATDEYDADQDGFDSAAHGGTDCDDNNSAINPDAEETWYDGTDSDCDGANDYDQDGDGHDADAHGGDDCDDLDSLVHPGADETWYDGVDSDCDGTSDYDQDGDGHDADVYGGDDCDDLDPEIFTGAEDVPDDNLDQDCDGADATEGLDDTGADTGKGGCSCTSVPAAPFGGWAALGALFLWRRRSRH